MIIDKLTYFNTYFHSSEMKAILEDLNKNFSISSEDGVYERQDHYNIKVMSPETLEISDIIESHSKEIDVQILLSGTEKIKIFSEENVTIKNSYNPDIDCTFYNPKGDSNYEIILQPGYFIILFPQDIHNPLIAVNGRQTLKKIVIKINVHWYENLKK